MQFVFIEYPSRSLSKYIESKVLNFAYYHISSFFKRSVTSLPTSFSAWFLKNRISHVILLTARSHCLYLLKYREVCVL